MLMAGEKEKKLMNPSPPGLIDRRFGKELAKGRLGVITYKQWLFWTKLRCLNDLKVPYLGAMMAEGYLSFLQKYLLSLRVHEMIRTLMLLQSAHFITQSLKNEVERIINMSELQQRFFYSALSRLFFQQKMYLHKLTELVFSLKPLPMKEQQEQTLRLLERLAEMKVYYAAFTV